MANPKLNIITAIRFDATKSHSYLHFFGEFFNN